MKILFASMPADGHFNPLTGVAVHLRSAGHDVRWYTGPGYAKKLEALGVPHLPFVKADDVNGENLPERFPEYKDLGLGPKAIAFALEKIFFGNTAGHLDDIKAVRADFPFEAIVFDSAFYAGRLVAETMKVPAFPIWPGPTPAPVSRQAPPPFFGLRPMGGPLGKLRDAIVKKVLASSMKGGIKLLNALRAREGLAPFTGDVCDIHNDTSAAMFGWGCPGLEFPRTDWPKNAQFAGALLPRRTASTTPLPAPLVERLARFGGSCAVVSQGTIDNRDPTKLFEPTLAAFTTDEALRCKLLVVTTGGQHTAALRERFSVHDNVVIEDWIDFNELLPSATVLISNGGAGSVMHALVNGVPVVAAGKLEGKNDICARLDYRKLAVDLRTERPSAKQIAAAVQRVLGDPTYRANVERVRAELATYDTNAIIARTVLEHAGGRG